MIPKIIHYCWFGGDNIPEEYNNYINEWKTFHPTWSIRKWNELNSPKDSEYMQTAYAHKNWANMSNLIRVWAIEKYGGIYLDTDIKLIQPLEKLLENECFFGYEEGESGKDLFWVNNAIFGAKKEHPFITKLHKRIIQEFDGTEKANLSAPRILTNLLKEEGLTEYRENVGKIKIYPKEYFYPLHYNKIYDKNNIRSYIVPETIAVHMWARSWFSNEMCLNIIDEQLQLIDHQGQRIKQLESIERNITTEITDTKRVLFSINQENEKVNELSTKIEDIYNEIVDNKQNSDFLIAKFNQCNLQNEILLKKNQDDLIEKEKLAIEKVKYETELEFYKKNSQKSEKELESLKIENQSLQQKLVSTIDKLEDKNLLLNEANQLAEKNKSSEKIQALKIENLQHELKLKIEDIYQKEKSISDNQKNIKELENQAIEHLSKSAHKDVIIDKFNEERLQLSLQLDSQSQKITELININENLIKEKVLDSVMQIKKAISSTNEKINDNSTSIQSFTVQLQKINDYFNYEELGVDAILKEIHQLKDQFRYANTLQHKLNQKEYTVAELQKMNAQLVNAVNWYKATYENRKLSGIVKDRLYSLFKAKQVNDRTNNYLRT